MASCASPKPAMWRKIPVRWGVSSHLRQHRLGNHFKNRMINLHACDKHSKVGAGSGGKQDPHAHTHTHPRPREALELRLGPHPSAKVHVFTGAGRQVYVLEMRSAEPKTDSKAIPQTSCSSCRQQL